MEFYHLQDYFEATRHYSGIAAMMGYLVAADEVSAAVNRLHNAMSKIDIYGVVNVLECHCENAAAMEHFVRQWLDIDIRLLIERMNGNKQAFRKADSEMVEAYRFAISMSDVLHEADARVKERMEAEWAQIDNENALSDYQAFNDGFYGEIPLRDFLMRHIIDGVSLDIAVRRVRYLIGHCPDMAVRISLHKIIEEYKKQHIANDIAEMRQVAAIKPSWLNEEPTPEAQPSPSVQASAAADAPSLDFAHMESYTPTIPFDMSALYRFLLDERIIDETITFEQFTNCINHADMTLLWATTKTKNYIKAVLKCLKEFYQERQRINPNWFIACCKSIGKSTGDMTKMKISKEKLTDFCAKMKKIISKP